MASASLNSFFVAAVVSMRYSAIPKLLSALNTEQMMLQYVDVLFNTPFISYKTLKECILFTKFKNNGSNLNQMPLYVSLFAHIPEYLHFYVFALVDMFTLMYFIKLAVPSTVSTSLKTKFWLYLLNPLTFLNVIMQTQFVFTQFFIVAALYYCQNHGVKKVDVYKAAATIASSAYLDIYTIGLVLICLTFFTGSKEKNVFVGSF